MKKLLFLALVWAALAGCVGMSGTDGDSTKQWIKIESSRSDLDGKITDVCYRLDLRFSPAAAANGFNTDMACITKCCWYSERKTVVINPNESFARALVTNGRGVKYTPESIIVNLSYSSFLNTIHGSVEPKSALKSGGLIVLEGNELKSDAYTLTMSKEAVKAANYDEGANPVAGTYLFRRQAEQAASAGEAAAAAQIAREEAATFNNAQERQGNLEQRLAYERNQAVLLLKRFYNKDIDAYILSVDKAQRAKGFVLLANDRSWVTTKIGSPIYRVACKVNGQLGKTKAAMKPHPVDCGAWRVDLDEKTVTAADAVARSIVAGEYKD